ncbi:MAG: malonyl-ACP O-methyltransferase BioC [Gammaproteobacteria bacterium]|nr:malonyl-ACP O-methyltransferase BioC [Gammaproteobacteria bacterium]
MNDAAREFTLDKAAIAASFSKAAAHYDANAFLQQEVGKRLLERLDYVKLEPELVVDLGCGTGALTRQLAKRYKKAKVLGIDLAPGMVAEARRQTGWFGREQYAVGDAEKLELAEASVDLLFSSLSIQWCADLDAVFREAKRVLRPGGLFMFTTLGPDTLKELRGAWSAVDGYTHVNAFMDMHDIGDGLVRARLADPVMDVEHIRLTYGDVYALMRDLKGIGAHNLNAGRRHGLTGKSRFEALARGYEPFREDGRLPATYEVVYGHAWGTVPPLSQEVAPGVFTVSLESLKRSLKRKAGD